MAEQSATEYVSTRLTPELMNELEKMAEDERRSLSFMTRLLLEEAIAARVKSSKRNGK